ncbi:MAG TPA: GNAT family N-acetyltransferase [Gemmatimonadaceae bacterium]|nr:GNAT family N-acetyltransferase [Gemmatimonadaceae bacterium]
MFRYTFFVHNFPSTAGPALRFSRAEATPSKTTVSRAVRADTGAILELVGQYAAQGLMLPRTFEQIAARIDNYVVVKDATGRVVACGALEEYSPSLAEVSSVAVAATHHGQGLGSQVVLGVERLARARDIEEIFALSLTDNFFLSLSYKPTTISRYPEKLARYDTLSKEGVEIVPKRCFQKTLGKSWTLPRLVEETAVASKQQRMVG